MLYAVYTKLLCFSKLICRKDVPKAPPKYNELDGNVNRRSHEGVYQLIEGVPR